MRFTRLSLPALLALLSCSDPDCPEGTTRRDGACIIDDGGTDAMADATPDATADAGPCGECMAPTPLCNDTTMMCVACLSETDCTGEDLCDDTGTCVECLGITDCSGDTPICTDGACEACTADPQCTELSDTPVCDEPSGACVACTADDETACGPNVCDLDTLSCTDTPAGESSLCTPCVSDRQCETGMTCAPMDFGGTDLGFFCLWRRESTGVGAPMGSCLNVRPYVTSDVDTTTRSGDTATVCTLRNATCAALADFSALDCDEPGAVGDAMCGIEGLDDGLCRNDMDLGNRCTYRCGSNDDCKSGFTCSMGATPDFCEF